MQLTLARWAAGLALLTVLAAGCGAASTNHTVVTGHASVSPVPTATAARHRRHHHHRATVPTVTTPPAPPASMNPIPQNNGGDHDADNNGGPIDGDGAI